MKNEQILEDFRKVRVCIENKSVQEACDWLKETVLSYILQNEEASYLDERVRTITDAYLRAVNSIKQPDEDEKKLIEILSNSLLAEKFNTVYNRLNQFSENHEKEYATMVELYNLVVYIINSVENEALKPFNDQGEYYAALAEMYRLQIEFFNTKYSCTYDERTDEVYQKSSHTWDEEKELLAWDQALTLFNHYTIKFATWMQPNLKQK